VGESITGVLLLGPLEVRAGDRVVPIVRPKQRALLAVLALEAGVCVSRDRLIDELWGESPPESAAHGLQVHVSGLRKLLGANVIVTCPGGYKLALDPHAVDAHRAQELLAAGDPDGALALFRGTPLADVELEGQAAHEAARFEDVRFAALEERFERELAAGSGAALVGPLERLVAESPLRERPRAQLMLALYRAGRQADALAAFQDARRTFVEELGIDPSPALRDMERAILQQDESLAATALPQAAVVEPRRRRRRMIAGALAFAVLASAAGFAAAYLLPPGHPSAAAANTTRVQTHSKPAAVRSHVAPKKVKPVVHVGRRHPAVVHHHEVSKPNPLTRHVTPTTTVAPATPVTTTARAPRPAAPIVTHPTRTTPAPQNPKPKPKPAVTTYPVATTPPPVTDPVHIVETFDGPVADARTWNVLLNGTGADAQQRNGKLVITIAAGAKPGGSYNFVGAQYGTRQCFSGDIDMQLDYHLVTWPPNSGAYVSLQAVFGDFMVERFSSQYGEGDVIGSIIQPRFTTAPASGTSGSLRVTRVNGVATTFYLLNGAWQQVDSAPAAKPAVLQFGLSMNPGISPSSSIAVEIDNFSATAHGPTSC